MFKVKDVTETRKLVREVNPEYWPTPLEGGLRNSDGALTGQRFEGDFLREHEWGRKYGFLSELVHAKHPFPSHRLASRNVLGADAARFVASTLTGRLVSRTKRRSALVRTYESAGQGERHPGPWRA